MFKWIIGNPYLAGAAIILAVGAYFYVDNRGYTRAADTYQARIDKLQSDIAIKTAEAEASDLRHARETEAARAKISSEVSHDYQTRLTALRARYDRLRASTEGVARCGVFAGVPGLPDTPGRLNEPSPGAGLPCPAALIATEQAIQLEALQNYLIEQQKVAP